MFLKKHEWTHILWLVSRTWYKKKVVNGWHQNWRHTFKDAFGAFFYEKEFLQKQVSSFSMASKQDYISFHFSVQTFSSGVMGEGKKLPKVWGSPRTRTQAENLMIVFLGSYSIPIDSDYLLLFPKGALNRTCPSLHSILCWESHHTYYRVFTLPVTFVLEAKRACGSSQWRVVFNIYLLWYCIQTVLLIIDCLWHALRQDSGILHYT